eukprot:CAMPEP_0204838484 /NCGR_PEP_ID=MMETSP1346-20131115/31147_1 /ASSEMBLY_ACC=CAM_ASM_000771 /TAXON_ID=215587 /ORGANISM="Aplanochytrium stocchinoi, Strain GSBS06" /LENGTH=471 /DNA_ID=CAMNT_0051974599 /DNA_START=321 /DNA_END=1736 /DNA_ORIENTATION=+
MVQNLESKNTGLLMKSMQGQEKRKEMEVFPIPTALVKTAIEVQEWLYADCFSEKENADTSIDLYGLYACVLDIHRVFSSEFCVMSEDLSIPGSFILSNLGIYASKAAKIVLKLKAFPDEEDKNATSCYNSACLVRSICLSFRRFSPALKPVGFQSLCAIILSLYSKTWLFREHTAFQNTYEMIRDATVALFCNAEKHNQMGLLLRTVTAEIKMSSQVCRSLDACSLRVHRTELMLHMLLDIIPEVLHKKSKQDNFAYHVNRQHGDMISAISALLDSHATLSLQLIQVFLVKCPEVFSRESGAKMLMLILNGVGHVVDKSLESFDLVVIDLSTKVLLELVRFYTEFVIKYVPLFLSVLNRLQLVLVKCNEKAPSIQDTCDNFARISEELSKNAEVFRHHAVYWLSDYVGLMKTPTIPSTIKQSMHLSSYYWLDMSSEYELQQIHAVSDNTTRSLFKSLYNDYEQFHKYIGKV